MKSNNVADFCKNAVGTMFLLAGAFFVCSTLVSMRAVLADPIAPMDSNMVAAPQATRAGANVRTARTSPRDSASTATVTRGTTARTVSNRNTTTTRTAVAPATTTTSRGTASRTVANRNTSSRTTAAQNRNVRARTATTTNAARVSLQGSAIRGSKATTSTYTYLSNKLYTGNYSNIIDSTTGLISADAYSNCLESYYTCMDEICTARNGAQGRCSCAARAKAFSQAQNALETANEELIKVSGELALLIATKGKDVSSAFQLTDAEKIMNCASYVEIVSTGTDSEITSWCDSHVEYTNSGATKCTKSSAPTYCKDMSSTYGFELKDLGGSGSDILASLRSWANAKDNAASMLIDDNMNLLSKYTGVMDVVSGMTNTTTDSDGTSLDDLANTWGYELFEYAHNNVCSRVLDSCFNGIYEACGTPPSGGKCANGSTSSCPYNYNSKITVSSTGDVTLNERGSTSSTSSSSATCFGYTSTSGDPYSTLRGPVADARRSVMQKYLLDANAACDAYGEQLRTTAQNIGYQKVAAQQALQQKRLEFVQEEATQTANDYRNAINNFNECLADLYDCYTRQEQSNPSWSTSRIKSYCAQISNAPSCYEQMICGTSNSTLQAVIDYPDDDTKACNPSASKKDNTCRNIITISEILSDSYAKNAVEGSSKQMREQCLQNMGISGVRNWRPASEGTDWNTATCPSGQHLEGKSCIPNTKACEHSDPNAQSGIMRYNTTIQSWGGCELSVCKSGYVVSNGQCVAVAQPEPAAQ